MIWFTCVLLIHLPSPPQASQPPPSLSGQASNPTMATFPCSSSTPYTIPTNNNRAAGSIVTHTAFESITIRSLCQGTPLLVERVAYNSRSSTTGLSMRESLGVWPYPPLPLLTVSSCLIKTASSKVQAYHCASHTIQSRFKILKILKLSVGLFSPSKSAGHW